MPNYQERFAKSCSDAMFGYASAASETYWACVGQALTAWASALRADPTAESAASWYRPERQPRSALLPRQSATPSWPFPRFDDASPFLTAGAAMPNPWAIWFGMFPLRGSPASWPMAFAMLSAGVPQAIAWPTARANAAMLDAAEAARAQTEALFSSYRTDGGHVSAALRPVSKATPVPMWPAFGANAWTWPFAA